MPVPQNIALPLWRQLKNAGLTSPGQLLAHFRIVSPPVPVEELAERLDVGVAQAPINWKWAGEVSVDDDVAQIFVARLDSRVRQRFTVAHELGHLMLHDVDAQPQHRDYDFTGGRKEVEANNFAAELLMPASMVALGYQGTGGSISELSKMFDVSEQAVGYRLKNLRIIP